jgi:hypothetical protein
MWWPDFRRLLILAAMMASLQAGPTPEPNPKASPSEAADFDLPVPVGMPVNGIRGATVCGGWQAAHAFEAAVAKKLDEQQVEMQQVKLEALDSDGKKIFVELPHAVFNLESRILTGQDSAKIYREDFEITGDSIEFNTKTRFGTMRGNVRMIISTEETSK